MPAASPIRVLLAICDPIAAIGLRTVLEAAEGIVCTAVEATPEALRSGVAQHAPDVTLMDVVLRRADPRLLIDLVAARPEMRVLVYLDHSPQECALQHMLALGGRARLSRDALARLDDCCLTSLRQRANGCIGTGMPADMVVRSVRAVVEGEVVAAPWLATLAQTLHDAGGPAPITVRELEIMSLLAEGLSNKEISKRLGIREQTVKNHVTRTMEKLGVSNRTEVGLLAARHRIRLADETHEEPAGSR